MNKRERIMAAVVGAMLLTVGCLYIVRTVGGWLDQRHNQKLHLERKVADYERTMRLGASAKKRLEAYQERSLPSDSSLARSLYDHWLLTKAAGAGFESIVVSPLPSRPYGEVYVQHLFLVSGEATLHQLTDFLHSFYTAGYLHRVGRLNAKPLSRSKKLDVSMTLEALSLNGAANGDELQEPPPERLAHDELTTYVNTIVSRNIFGPPNSPPRLSLNTQTGHPGKALSYRVGASDADENDQLSYSLAEPLLEGARIDPESGELEWTPDKLGDYQVGVQVTDNGMPAKSITETVKISVVEPPPAATPAPSFDPAEHSVITGITEIQGKRQIWVTVRTEGRVVKRFEGDRLAIGTVDGVISRIGTSEVEIETNEGQTIVVGLGRSLRSSEGTPLGGI